MDTLRLITTYIYMANVADTSSYYDGYASFATLGHYRRETDVTAAFDAACAKYKKECSGRDVSKLVFELEMVKKCVASARDPETLKWHYYDLKHAEIQLTDDAI